MRTANIFFKPGDNILPSALCTYLRFAIFCFAIISLLSSTVIGQVISETPAGVSEDCQVTYKLALQLTQEYDARLPSAERTVAETVVDRAVGKGSSRADGYNEYGGGAMMQAQYESAAWGSLKAATLEWNPLHITNVGIYLSYLNRLDEAGIFLQCASKLAPQSPFVIEAQAMLAYRKLDYKSATRLIEQAVRMMPGDMNVRYTAGVIFYKSGDRLRAKQYLQEAQRIVPNYPTIIKALKVVDPSGQSSSPPQDAMDKLVAECFRYMDEMLIRGEAAGRYREEMRVVEGISREGIPAGGDEYERLRRDVQQNKAEITNLELRARNKQNVARSVDWNATLQACILAYLTTTTNYQSIIIDRVVDILIAQSMRMTPIRLVEKMKLHGSSNSYRYVIQDEKFKFYQVEDPARKTYSAGAKSCEGRSDDNACRRPYEEAYCATVIPVWISHWNNVLANMRSAEAGYPDVAKDYANRWKRLANQAAEYSKRGLSAMKPVTEAELKHLPAESRQMIIGIASPEAHSKLTKDLYKSYIGSMTSLLVAPTLSQSNEVLVDALDTAPAAFLHSAFYVEDCQQKKPDTLNLDAAIEKLIAALNEASEFDGGFVFECELEIGGWKIAYKPLSTDNTFNIEHENYKVDVDPANNRWGGEAGPPPLDGNYGALTGEVSVKVWGERNILGGGPPDYGVQFEGKVGVGGKIKGVGGAACYFGRATYKFNARAFASALTR